MHSRLILALGALAASTAFVVPQVRAQDQVAQTADVVEPSARQTPRTTVQLASGISFSDGDYGRTSSTQVVSIPLSLRVRRGPWSLRLALSHLTIDGPASIVDADGGEVAGDPTDTRSGFGDVSVTVARYLDLTATTRLTGEVRVKLPTASQSERLSTGTTDVMLRGRLTQELGDLSLRAGAQRRFAGGDGRVVVRDTWGASGGASLALEGEVITGIDLTWLQSSYAGNGDSSNATAFVSMPLARRIRMTGYGAAGVSRNSADFTLGASVTWRID